ncbi:hypothetical protein PROFUN_04424 [Planoprotostelium fungivorum]|uniref:Uncharacterized protein n=1 Tax=Planoprotostelium fungivorum TaxID=1890364 RepID=A0A2P6NVN7_9EUKA|nr:hypothetical protein PROFUN_04424 [Planoprotostelium fungivorum]
MDITLVICLIVSALVLIVLTARVVRFLTWISTMVKFCLLGASHEVIGKCFTSLVGVCEMRAQNNKRKLRLKKMLPDSKEASDLIEEIRKEQSLEPTGY